MGSKYSECPLDKDVRNKLSSVGSDLELGIRQWIEGMTGDRFVDRNFAKSLKSGVLLCKLANRIKPGICPKIQESSMPFVQMENINSYLNAAKKLGVPSSDLFMTVDLFEEKNVGQVIRNLDVLRRITNTGGVKSSPAAPVSVSVSSSAPVSRSPASPSFSSSPRTTTPSSPSFSSSPRTTTPSSPSYSSSPRTTTPSSPSYSSSSSSSPSYGSSSPRTTAATSYKSPSSPVTSRSPSSSPSLSSAPRVPVGVHNPAPKIEPVCPLDKDLKDKLSMVGGGGLEEDVKAWVERVSGERFPDRSFAKSLKNGVILCKLANKIRPGICKAQNSPAPFVQMENINSYLNAAKQFGVPSSDLFMTVDLYEEKNIGQVIRNLDVLRRVTGR